MITVDLRSDTMTRPTPGMRQAMFNAEVGDDCFGEDPTVNRLEEAMAALTGKEAGLLVTSGTQGNQLAVRAQTHHGDDVVAEHDCHLFNAEAGALSALSGVQTRLLKGDRGVITPEQIEEVVRPKDVHYGRTALIAVENTHNKSSGSPWSLEALAAVYAFARPRNIRVHMDGARLFNAVVATGISAQTYGRYVDTFSICLSKGLGAPVGSVVVGDRETIDRARYFRKMFGGGMRQAGVLAAAGLYALEHNISRMADDHRRARRFAEALADMPGVGIDLNEIRTNMLFFTPPAGQPPEQVVRKCETRGVRMLAMRPGVIRAVTHLDIDDTQIEYAIDVCRETMPHPS
ncbi:MAG: aminotransferase class I/II-fold pyridoxal phosphate-dependent enzyme [candidate division Zixibacteria bacterium]|nr:aminotransferase class I/II-fold pyridoxal phosphate-dependent enzyme [candidate division Zixibacteria bacterium]